MQLSNKWILLIGFMSAAANAVAQNYQDSNYASYKANKAAPCTEGSPWMLAREKGRFAYAERHENDLRMILIENKPMLIDTYGKCMEALSMLDALPALFNPSVYVNTISIKALKELIYKRVIDAVCAEIQDEAEEVYGIIADIIPTGNYVYDLEDVFRVEVAF